MSEHLWVLHAAVFGAAFLQSASGIGFGVIAGPVILIAMNDGAAIQISILLSFLIAVVLAPSLYKAMDRTLLKPLVVATLFGAPLGILVFLAIEVVLLKVLAGLAVAFMALAASGLFSARTRRAGSRRGADFGIGAISGAMSAALAMPGPAIAAYMAASGRAKATTRATVLILFVFSYPIAFACQALTVGVPEDALSLSALLVPATLIGVVLGRLAVPLISERVFRTIVVVVLCATALGLFASL
jgi:uncharacterized membrane protein YfcA